MIPIRPWMVLRWLEVSVCGEAVYSDWGALMRGVEVVVVGPVLCVTMTLGIDMLFWSVLLRSCLETCAVRPLLWLRCCGA